MGAKINTKTQTTPQTGDEWPINRAGADFKVSPEDLPDYLATQGMLLGDPSAIYAENQTDGKKWQIGQKVTALPLSTSPDIATPNLEQSQCFFIQPSGTEFELQLPSNPPSAAQLGSPVAGVMYFVIYARNASSGTAGGLTFGSDYIKLPGSKPYLKDGTNLTNIIHCWYSITGKVYYRIDNSLPIAIQEIEALSVDGSNQTQPDLLVTNNYTLTLNGSDVEILTPSVIPYDGYEWTVYVSQTAGGDTLTFNSTQLGDHVNVATGPGDISIVKFVSIGPSTYYRVIPERQTLPAELIEFDVTIPSADILTSNTTTLDMLAGTGAGKWIANVQLEAALVDGDTLYDTNTNLQVFRLNPGSETALMEIDLSTREPQRYNGAKTGGNALSDLQSNGADGLRGKTETGNPANGNYDLRIWGTYRILDA